MANIYLFYGNDEFAIARKLREFEGDFPDPTTADMNIARLDARTASDNDLNNAVNAMPFLANKRLVILSNPSARYAKPDQRKKFEEFLAVTSDTTRLVIHELMDPRDAERHWLVKWAGKNGVKTQAFMLPRARDMAGWIVNEAKNQGGTIEAVAATRLSNLVGSDTRQASMELAKLLAHANWSRPIRVEDVDAVSILTAEPDIFAFVDALAKGEASAALDLWHRLLEDQDAMALWGMIIRQFRLLLLAREVIDAHGMVPDVQEALQQVGVGSSFVGEKAYSQAQHFTMASLEAIYHRLLLMDESAKTSQVPLDLAVDMLVGEMAK